MRTRRCQLIDSLWDYFLVSFVAVIIFFFVACPPFNQWLVETVPSQKFRSLTGALLLFVGTFLTVRLHDQDEIHCS